MSRFQPTDTSKKEAAKKPVLGKFGNLFSSNKKKSLKTNPASPTSPNCEKTLSPSKLKDKEGLKDKTRTQGSVTVDTKTRNGSGGKISPVEAPSDSSRKRGTLIQSAKDNPSEKEGTKGGENLGQITNDSNSPPLGAGTEKESDSKLSFNGLPAALESLKETSANSPAASLQGSIAGGTGEKNGSASEIQLTNVNGSRERLTLKETNTGKELDTNLSNLSPTCKKTGVSVANVPKGPAGNTDSRKAKLLFRLKPCDPENVPSSATDEAEVRLNPNSSPSDETFPSASVKPGQEVVEQPPVGQDDAKESNESPEKTSDSPNPAKVLTVDIYLTKAVETSSSGPPAPSTPKEAPADTDSAMERRANANSNRKSSKKRRSFRFNAITTDEQLAGELACLGEAATESSPPHEGRKEKGAPAAAPESSVKSPPSQQPPTPEPRATGATSHRVSPKGDSDKSKQQLPPSSPTKRKGAKEGQPPSPVPASPTARKSQPALKSQQLQPPAGHGSQPPNTAGAASGSVSTTKGAAAPGDRTTPPPSPQGSPTAGDAPRTPSTDSSPESRKLQRENSTTKKGPLSTGKRDLEKSTERLAAPPSSEAPKHKSNAVILPKSTQTSKLHIPARPKSVDFSVKTKRSESLENIEETAVDPQIKGNTAKKISLFENKTSNQSHRQIDFYATKSIPLTKKYVGRAKLKFGKQANEAEQIDLSPSKQNVAQKSLENGRPLQKGLEEIKVKFETAMEGETGAKTEAVNGTSLKKKGSTGGSKPVQPQKAAMQVNSERVNSATAKVDKDSMMPDTASFQHKQVHDLEQHIITKNKEECTEPHGNTTILLAGETDKTALLGQNVDLPQAISSNTIVDSSVHAVTDKHYIKSLTEPVCSPKEPSVESLENKIIPQGKKSSMKSPARKGDKPIVKKNDRSKKKQPSGAEPSLVQDQLIVQQPEESAGKLKSPNDVVDASASTATKTVELTCGSEPSQQETIPFLDDLIHNRNNVPAAVEEKVLHEITGISEPADCGVEASQAGVQLNLEGSDHAQTVPTRHKHNELQHNCKETSVDGVPPFVLKDNCLDVVENEEHSTFETNQSTFVETSENTKKNLCEAVQGFNADLAEGASVTVSESTQRFFDSGKNKITDLIESASFATSENKKRYFSENAECVITDSNEDMLVSSGKSTRTEMSASRVNSMSEMDKMAHITTNKSTEMEQSEKEVSAEADFRGCAFVVPGESTKTELSEDQGHLISDSDQSGSLTSEGTQSELSENWEDAVADLNEIPPFAATMNSELTDTEELVSICDTKQENISQDSLTLQQDSFESYQAEESILTVKLENTKDISQEPDSSSEDQSQIILDVSQIEEINLVVESPEDLLQKEEDDMLSHVVPDNRVQNDLSVSIKRVAKEEKKENGAVQKIDHQISEDQTLHEGVEPLADCPKGEPNIEMECQNGDPTVESDAVETQQNIDTQKQNVCHSVQDFYALNLHFSNGSLGNGLPYDRNGIFNSKSPSGVFNFSATSDDNHLDSSGEMEKFTEIIRQLDSPSTVHQKRKKQRIPRSPQPSFGLPPIHEDYLEKIFDSDMFTFGLGKKARSTDLAPALMLKMQNTDSATRIRPKRASTEQSFLVKSLRASSKDAYSTNEEIDGKENSLDVNDPEVKRSRLEKSTLFSSLKSPFMTTSKENVFSPSVTSIGTITTTFSATQNDSSFASPNSFDTTALSENPQMSAKAQSSILDQGSFDNLSSDLSTNPNTSLASLNVPSCMEKYLKTDDEKQAQNLLSVVPLPLNKCTDVPKTDKFPASSSDPKNVSGLLESIPKMQSSTLPGTDGELLTRLKPSLPELNPSLKVLEVETAIGSGKEKINPRPGKVVIFGEPNFSGNVIEIFADVPDCSSWELSEVISIKIVRGCWLLYEKPNFEGLSIPLEEGEMELTNLWGEQITDEKSTSPTVIGSLRQVVKDYRICQIDLFTESDGLGLVTSYFDDTEEVQVYDRLQKTCSIKVHWGIWLIYEDAGFQGVPFILEPGEYPNLAFWDTHEAYIGSMRPLKMGGRKVEIPNEPKICVYEKPFFEGMELELDGEMFSLGEVQTVPGKEQSGKEQISSFTTVASMRVLGGIWVGYEKPGFEGRQYLLEEGDYPLWSDWGGYNEQLQSLRPLLSDFSTSHMIMYSDKDFGEKGSNINVLGIISNMEDTGYGTKTQSINVLSGVWVAYEYADFTGEQYVLEKGKYSSFEDWGAKSFRISSVQPIMLDAIGSPVGKFKVLLFSEAEFRGNVQVFEENISQVPDSFMVKSCKVLAGSWVAFDGEDFGGCQYILEEGAYPDLFSMGCQANTTLQSLHVIDYEFSEPVIVLYGKHRYKGKKIEFTSETVSLQCLGYTSRVSSVEVLGGQWVIYEYSNYRGRQILLSPDKIPDWYTISGWHTIGSLRPLIQKRVYFKIRNKSTGMFVGTNGNLDDLKLLRLQVIEDTGAEDQIWAYHEGFLKCRIAEDCCVAVSGSLVISGSKLSLSLEEEKSESQLWSISPDGRIRSRMKPNLVFDIKGGTQYDQKQVILNTVCAEKETQCWELLVL